MGGTNITALLTINRNVIKCKFLARRLFTFLLPARKAVNHIFTMGLLIESHFNDQSVSNFHLISSSTVFEQDLRGSIYYLRVIGDNLFLYTN